MIFKHFNKQFYSSFLDVETINSWDKIVPDKKAQENKIIDNSVDIKLHFHLIFNEKVLKFEIFLYNS